MSTFQPKIQTFACNYLASRVKDGHVTYEAAKTAGTHITGASREVAEAFVDALAASAGSGAKLEATKFPSPSAPGEQACPLQVAMGKLGGVLGLRAGPARMPRPWSSDERRARREPLRVTVGQ